MSLPFMQNLGLQLKLYSSHCLIKEDIDTFVKLSYQLYVS